MTAAGLRPHDRHLVLAFAQGAAAMIPGANVLVDGRRHRHGSHGARALDDRGRGLPPSRALPHKEENPCRFPSPCPGPRGAV